MKHNRMGSFVKLKLSLVKILWKLNKLNSYKNDQQKSFKVKSCTKFSKKNRNNEQNNIPTVNESRPEIFA